MPVASVWPYVLPARVDTTAAGRAGGGAGGDGGDGGVDGGVNGHGGGEGGNGTAPIGKSLRTVWETRQSVISTSTPLGVTAIPAGFWNVATSEAPSADPVRPDPATVVTAREFTSSWRMTLLFASATSSVPPKSAICFGALNCALVPTASVFPGSLYMPASVVTVPLATSICRMRSYSSATYTVAPSGVTSTPHGLLNIAFVPTPSGVLQAVMVPIPARVVTVRVATSTRRTLCPL